MWKGFVKDYLTFTKKERTAVLVLLALIFIVLFLPYLWPSQKMILPAKDKIEELRQQVIKLKRLDSFNNVLVEKDEYSGVYDSPANKNYHKSKAELFYFDPNTLSETGWKRLGLRDRTVQTIQNYLAKGGKFRHAEDLSKIYGLLKNEYERLLPYVKFETTNAFDKKYETDKKEYIPAGKFIFTEKKNIALKIIDINTADTTALIALPGIGSKLASRIINFRDKLGGFYTVLQVAETYGLPDSTFQQIQSLLVCAKTPIRQININTADVNALRQHPYIKWNLANIIVQYRQQHGNYKAVSDLQQIAIITPEIYEKTKPYLKIE